MDFFNDLSRQLLRNSDVAHKAYTSNIAEVSAHGSDAEFFELAMKKTTTQMAYLEHNRVNHLLLKSAFESFQ
jgi:hypothetical protein